VTARLRIALIASAALVVAALLAAAVAQPFGPGAGMGRSWMLGRGGFRGACSPAAADFGERRAERFADLVKPTEAQRAKFDEFKAASIKSARMMREACPAEAPQTIVGRTAATEKRMDAMLQAVRTMRPALEAFYATLSDEQKAKLDSSEGRGRLQRWRDRW
jgi:Spy/CpxP family protein refolding chaperone